MKILITGGAGFQGSHLTEFLLRTGHQISILNTYSEKSVSNLAAVLDKINLIWGSITDKELVDKSVRGHDVVIHMAARINVEESLKDPLAFFYSNILGAYNILEAIKNYGSRLIFVSTCEVYGDGHNLKDGELLNESAELKPNSPYAASKASADRICYAYFRSFDLDVTIVRPFNIYGERQKSGLFGALIPILTAKALKGENLTIFGDGSATRDYTHVSDIVRAYNLILENSSLKGKAINFASGQNTKIKDIAEYIAIKFGVRVVHGPSRLGEVMRFPADISFAGSLGYVPKISIWEGIDRYLEWAKLNLK
jgi:dTDP-glucose 4,6-dehydratase